MRRADKECKDIAERDAFLARAEVMQLAINAPNAAPYIVPVNFYYEDGAFFIHSATVGRKIELLKASLQVGFCVNEMIRAIQTDPNLPCSAGTRFHSVVGTANCVFIEDGKEEILKKLLAKYLKLQDVKFHNYYMDNIALMRLDSVEMAYKRDLRGE